MGKGSQRLRYVIAAAVETPVDPALQTQAQRVEEHGDLGRSVVGEFGGRERGGRCLGATCGRLGYPGQRRSGIQCGTILGLP